MLLICLTNFCIIVHIFLQGYYRKGCALLGLNKKPEAAVVFLHCLARDPDKTGVKKSLAKVCNRITCLFPFFKFQSTSAKIALYIKLTHQICLHAILRMPLMSTFNCFLLSMSLFYLQMYVKQSAYKPNGPLVLELIPVSVA